MIVKLNALWHLVLNTDSGENTRKLSISDKFHRFTNSTQRSSIEASNSLSC